MAETDSYSSDSDDNDHKTSKADFLEVTVGFLYLTPVNTEMPKSWTIIDQVRKRPPLGWVKTFSRCDKILLEISRDHEGVSFLPDAQFLFRAFHLTPIEKVKVVIIGQDPYPDEENACGLAFSVRPGSNIPGSLRNIFTELKTDIKGFKMPKHGDLTYWAAQGVLLLNKDLSVGPGKPGSHREWWKNFLPELIHDIKKANRKTIWILWGRNAQELQDVIQSEKYTITGVHPSPMSAHMGFFGGKYFSKANALLKANGQKKIDWQI